ncbi:photosynthetic reaction center subunit H [Brevundimonas subvibrioides]|uniref:photosynthetic reaction center subunit H n=1 Tax=Brevundimonas subvibrioides TaxID=74313 RepID=UPI0022B46172|nr:photosynthetic reaction center subunit H [Brevundimonas subvibrioides]
MDSPYLFGDFDAAEFCLIAFFLFFAGLVFYLRREDRREGYPLEDDVTGRKEPLGGLFFTARPKTFILPHGHGTRTLPRDDNRDTRQLAARRSAMTDGSPIEPTGNPLIDGIGPGGYADRPKYPDLTIDGAPRIVPLRVAAGFLVSSHDTDPRGLAVLGCDGLKAGEVSDIWVDRSEQLIRYLEVAVGARKVLLPMTMAIVDGGARAVKVRAITAAQFADVPGTASADQVTLYEEERVIAYYGGGHLYATRDRQEPWL